jgi:DHHC palmitoyltransferase
MNVHHPTARSRRNGLDRPWGYAQIGAWIAYGVSILQYIIFISPFLAPCITSPILSLLFFTSNILVFFFASYTILVNPIDIHLHQYRTINEMQQLQNNNTHHGHENEAAATTNGTTSTNKTMNKPITIRNPLYQPPITLMIPNETSSTTKLSYSDRLYYRTNAKQLQLYNRNSCLYQDQQCNTNHNHSQPQYPCASLPNEPMKQCWICDASVAEHSMHCKFCNKCVYGFDHHCICTWKR